MGAGLTNEQNKKDDTAVQANEPCAFAIPKKYEPSEQRRSSSVCSANIGTIDTRAYSLCSSLEGLGLAQDPPPLGTLSFEARYQSYEERLTIRLIGAKRLPVRHHVTELGESPSYGVLPCDPKVFLCLLPDEKPVVESYTKEGTWDPDFNETFVFKIGKHEVKEKTVRFTVYDCTRLNRLCPIGHALFSLKKGQDLNGDLVIERDIKSHCQTYGHRRGEISVSLAYLSASSRLTVVITKARNILQLNGHARKEYYVKISHIHINRKVKTKRTPSSEGGRNPVFNHTLTFKVAVNQLSDSCLVLTLMNRGNHCKARGSATIGRVVLGPYVFDRQNERSHWGQMIRSPARHIEQWHLLYL